MGLKLTGITGVNNVINKLKRTKPMLGKRVAIGAKDAGLELQRMSQLIVPVHKGPLKASAFTRNVGGNGFDVDVVVGYTALYAVFVHEDLDKAHGRLFNVLHAVEIANAHTAAQKKLWFNRGEEQQAKFLEKPARENRKELIKIIYDSVVK